MLRTKATEVVVFFIAPNKNLLDQRLVCARSRVVRAYKTQFRHQLSSAALLLICQNLLFGRPSHVYDCGHITLCDWKLFPFGLIRKQ